MCDTMAIVETGRVLFAKNSDRDPNEAQILDWRPRQTYRHGANVRCTWVSIPQVPETHAVLLSRPFWMWGAEMGANEHGVVAGNEAVFTRQPCLRTGLTGMDLLRLALERGETATRACEILIELLETHGQGGGCGHENRNFIYHNSFIVADPKHAFVLETAGKLYAVEPVSDRYSISNGLTIPGFARIHENTLKSRVSACKVRRARTRLLLEKVSNPLDLFAILRDHAGLDTAPAYRLLNGGMHAVCMHAGGLAAAAQTTASWVSELSPEGCRHWVTATAAPCTSIFKPVDLRMPVDTGPVPTDRADDSFWWTHERFHRRVLESPEEAFPVFVQERDALEAAWVDMPPEPTDAFAEHRSRIEAWSARLDVLKMRPARPFYVTRYWRTRNRRAGLEF